MALSRKFQNRIMPSCRAFGSFFCVNFVCIPCRIILRSTVSDKLNRLSVFKCNLILRYDMWPLNFVYFHFCFEDMRGRLIFSFYKKKRGNRFLKCFHGILENTVSVSIFEIIHFLWYFGLWMALKRIWQGEIAGEKSPFSYIYSW